MVTLHFTTGFELHMALHDFAVAWGAHCWSDYRFAYQNWIEMPWEHTLKAA